MTADPASQIAIMSSMMEELGKSKLRLEVGEELEQHTRSRFSLTQLPKSESVRNREPEDTDRNVRFP